MTWQRYDLIFRLHSPLHIGARKTGNLNETRGYVHGKVLWAVLTARLTRDHDDGASGARYVNIGDAVKKHFRFTYLYPALANARDETPISLDDVTTHYPWEDDFAYRFLDSYASTALDYDYQAAEAGSLHETEFIRPFARSLDEAAPPPVYLAGSLYARSETTGHCVLRHWPQVLRRLRIGGERTYGWGRLKLVSDMAQPSETSNSIPQSQHTNGYLIAHARAVGNRAVQSVSGTVEPLVGWERNNGSNSGKTWRVSEAEICYAPGARVVNSDSLFKISSEYGVLEAQQAEDEKQSQGA